MSPTLFNFKGNNVRVIDKDGVLWFNPYEAGRVLEIRDVRTSLRKFPANEKGRHSMPTLGGAQNITLINEAGLYRLIFQSRKKEAEEFKTWIFSEVIPTIRRTGRYETGADSAANEAAAVAWVLGQIARTMPWAKVLELILPLHAYGSLAANGQPRTGFRRPAFVAAPHRTAAATDFQEHTVLVKLLARQQELPFREGGIRE